MASPTKAKLNATFALKPKIAALAKGGASFADIQAALSLTTQSLAGHLRHLGINLPTPKAIAKFAPPPEAGSVAKDSGAYMEAVRRLNVAPPETLTIVVRARRRLPPRVSMGAAGCAAALCAEAGDKTRLF